MRNAGGYAQLVMERPGIVTLDRLRCEQVPEGVTEFDTFTCHHCNGIVHVMPRMDPANLGGLCKRCMKLICPRCLDQPCLPHERRMIEDEARAQRFPGGL